MDEPDRLSQLEQGSYRKEYFGRTGGVWSGGRGAECTGRHGWVVSGSVSK